MQFSFKDYDPALHDKYKAITVKQPYADLLLQVEDVFHGGITYAKKSIEVRHISTGYRGDILVCSSKNPNYFGKSCGTTIGFVELYDVKPVSEFTELDWLQTRIAPNERGDYQGGFGWYVRNPRRVVEMPSRGQLGIYNFVCTKGEIIEYPRAIMIDAEAREQFRKELLKK